MLAVAPDGPRKLTGVVNQGIYLDWMTNSAQVLSRDQSGDRRLRDDRVDMGAYEFRAFGTRYFVR